MFSLTMLTLFPDFTNKRIFIYLRSTQQELLTVCQPNQAKQNALKVQWVFLCSQSSFFVIIVSEQLIPSLGLYIFRCNLHHSNV